MNEMTRVCVMQAVTELLDKACHTLLLEYTCLEIRYRAVALLETDHKLHGPALRAQARIIVEELRLWGVDYCKEAGIDYHWSFVEREVRKRMQEWDDQYQCRQVCNATKHALRLDWLLFLKSKLKG